MSQNETGYRLYGDSRSGNCYKAALTLRLTGRQFDWIETDIMAGESRTETFLAMNPNGRVPVIIFPDGRILSESNAILLHLSEGTQWLPAEPYERALVYQWLFFEQYSHEPYIAVLRFLIHFAKTANEQPDRVAALLKRGHQALAVMETRLAQQPFLAGRDFTVADIALYAYTHVAGDGGFDLEPYPSLRDWLERVSSQPGFVPMNEACR